MKKRIFLFCLILMQFFVLNYGQKGYTPGYVVTNEFDTLRGYIKLKTNIENSKSCDFTAGENQIQKNYLPSNIKAYRILNSKYYVSKEIEIDSVKKNVFLEYLVNGIVNLYYFSDLGNEYYFIEKNGVLTQLSNKTSIVTVKGKGGMGEYESNYSKNSNQYKRVLQFLFQESPEALKEIPGTAFDYKPLIKLTKDYHNSVCKDRSCIDFTKSTNKTLYLEPYFGIINSWMGLKTSKDRVHQLGMNVGAQLRFKPFKGYSTWNFLMGLNLSSNNFTGDFVNSLNQYGLPYWIHDQYSILRIPLTMEYTAPLQKVQPFFSFGYTNVLLSNPKYEVIRVHGDLRDPEYTKFRKYEYAGSLGFGLKLKASDDFYAFIKNELEYRIPGANFGYVLDQTSVFSDMISFGCGFRIK